MFGSSNHDFAGSTRKSPSALLLSFAVALGLIIGQFIGIVVQPGLHALGAVFMSARSGRYAQVDSESTSVLFPVIGGLIAFFLAGGMGKGVTSKEK